MVFVNDTTQSWLHCKYLRVIKHICIFNKTSITLRYRVKTSEEIAEVAKEGWVAPSPAGIHWDGKIMQSLRNQYNTEDRLLVLVSG